MGISRWVAIVCEPCVKARIVSSLALGLASREAAEAEWLMDWDDAYSNAAYIPNAAGYPGIWAREAIDFRAQTQGELDIPYAARARERFDLFLPDAPPKGLFVFVHGGYWMEFDKSSWSHLARGAVARGWAAVIPSYDLCPEVSLSTITWQVGTAINKAATRIEGPIVISGHSAGGHLAARMVCKDTPLDKDVGTRVRRAVGISGLYDLRPLMKTSMNKTLKLNDKEVNAESPIHLDPAPDADVLVWVGADERPEFIRQSKKFSSVWAKKGAHTDYVIEPGCHHFDVIKGLCDADSELMRRALGD